MWPNLQETADLVTFTKEIPNGKLRFFVQWDIWKGPKYTYGTHTLIVLSRTIVISPSRRVGVICLKRSHLKVEKYLFDLLIFFILFLQALFVLEIFKLQQFFPIHYYSTDSEGLMKLELTAWTGLHKLANVIFGGTQKPHSIWSSKLPKW